MQEAIRQRHAVVRCIVDDRPLRAGVSAVSKGSVHRPNVGRRCDIRGYQGTPADLSCARSSDCALHRAAHPEAVRAVTPEPPLGKGVDHHQDSAERQCDPRGGAGVIDRNVGVLGAALRARLRPVIGILAGRYVANMFGTVSTRQCPGVEVERNRRRNEGRTLCRSITSAKAEGGGVTAETPRCCLTGLTTSGPFVAISSTAAVSHPACRAVGWARRVSRHIAFAILSS